MRQRNMMLTCTLYTDMTLYHHHHHRYVSRGLNNVSYCKVHEKCQKKVRKKNNDNLLLLLVCVSLTITGNNQ